MPFFDFCSGFDATNQSLVNETCCAGRGNWYTFSTERLVDHGFRFSITTAFPIPSSCSFFPVETRAPPFGVLTRLRTLAPTSSMLRPFRVMRPPQSPTITPASPMLRHETGLSKENVHDGLPFILKSLTTNLRVPDRDLVLARRPD